MLILAMALLMGLLVGAWGFLACFFPERWERLTAVMGFIADWTPPPVGGAHRAMRFVRRAVGFVFFVVGCGFAYVGASGIFLVLAKRATIRPASAVGGGIASSSTLPLTLLSAFVLVAGVLMAAVPEKAVRVWAFAFPPWRSLSPVQAQRVRLFTRLCGLLFALLATMSLVL